MPVKGRVAIVTGAGAGLGRAYALHLAGLGWRIVVNNRRRLVDDQGRGSAQQLAAQIVAAGGEAIASEDDVGNRESGERLVGQALESWGRLDALIANAGIDQHRAFHKIEVNEFLEVLQTNFHGSLFVTHAAYRQMRSAGHGRIVLSASSAGLHGLHGLSAYASAKAALLGLMRTLAAEGASRDVLCNAIAPYAATPMTVAHNDSAVLARMHADAVAPLVAALVDPESSINGQAIVVGGGRFRRAAAVESPRMGRLVAGDGLLPSLSTELAHQAASGAGVEFPDALAAFHNFAAAQNED